MKTRISSLRNTRYELVVDDGKKGSERRVLAGMTLFEGTRAWRLVDIRLDPHGDAHAYSGSAGAEDISSQIRPEDEEEAALIRSRLHTFTEEAGLIRWSTYAGLVKGTPREDAWLARSNHVGFFTRAEGLAYLREAQAWWMTYEGHPRLAKIHNPLLQPSSAELIGELSIRRLEQVRAAQATAFKQDAGA